MARSFGVLIKDRNLSANAPYIVHPDLLFVVNRYSHDTFGGPKELSITVFGSEGALWSLFDTLRCPIEIYNDNAECVWWGMIADCEVRTSWIVAKATIDEMFNSVGVAYSDLGVRKTTEFLQNDFSVNLYGEKQYRLSMSEAGLEQAESRRATSLEITKFPIADIQFSGQGEGSLSATIICRGWMDTLEWQYYSQEKGLVQHSEGGSGRQKVGFTLFSTSTMFSGSTITCSACSSELLDEGEVIAIFGSGSGNDGTYEIADVSSVNVPIRVADVQAASVAAGPHTTSSVDFGASAASQSGFFWVFDIDRPNGNEEISASLQGSPDGSGSWLTAYEFTSVCSEERNNDSGASIARYRRAIYEFDGTGTFSASFLVGSGCVEGRDIEVTTTFPSRESSGGSIYITSGSNVVQRFSQYSGSSWDASKIYLRVQPSGSPTDFLVVRLRLGSGGFTGTCPGVVLASGSIAASDLTGDMEWQSIPLSACVTLDSETRGDGFEDVNYWLQVERSATKSTIAGASSNASAHYLLDVDEDLGYQDGFFLVYAGYQYNTRSPNADMLFKVTGTQKTNTQMRQVVEAEGQFIQNVDEQLDSGIETNQWRSGDNTALYEMEQLVSTGTASGTRVLLRINKERTLSIMREPENSTSTNYTIEPDRTLRNAAGQIVDLSQCFYGGWLSLGGVIPPNHAGFVSGLTDFFVEEAEYYPESNTYVPRSRGTRDPWDVSGITEG